MIRYPNDVSGHRLAVAATWATAATTTGLMIAGMKQQRSGRDGDTTSTTLGRYLLVRNGALCAGLLAASTGRRWDILRSLLAVNCAVQLGDSGIGFLQHDTAKTLGPLAFAALLGVATVRLAPPTPRDKPVPAPS